MSTIDADIGTFTASAPPASDSWWEKLKIGLFGTRSNALITLVTVALLLWLVPPLVRWTLIDAVWSGTSADCAAANGACWAFVAAKLRFMAFAFYPPDLQWRPFLAIVLIVGLVSVSAIPRFWRRELLFAWPVVIAASWLVMSGFWFLPKVGSNQWGGLTVTLIVWTICFTACLPLAITLALARRSQMAGIRLMAVAYIELMRAIPMVAILYVAMLILPMAVPGGEHLDKIVRTLIMITLFWAAYAAEVVRGGLQAIPNGQYEAAKALGIGYWRSMHLVILPQALRVVIPGMVNLAIGFFLATSLLTVIGIFDLLNAAKASATDQQWLGFYDEAYIVAALTYFVFCHGGSRYSRWLERHLGLGRR